MKKMLMVVAVIAAIGSVYAGGGKKESSGTAAPAKLRVAYIARAQEDSFAAWLADSMRKSAAKYSNIQLTVFDGHAEDNQVNSLIETAIANKFDAIIVQPNNNEAQRPYIEQSVKAGIVTFTINPRIEGIAGMSSVDASPYEQAAVNARAAVTQIPEGAKVVVLLGPSGNFHADERRISWQKEFFDKRADVEIVGEQIAHWNKDEAMRFMEDWVQANPQIDAIISMNDNMAAGAIEVIRGNPQFANTLSYGVDGTAEALLLIEEGLLTSTCLQSASELADLTMASVNKVLTGQEKLITTDIGTPLINKANVAQYITEYRASGLIK